MPPATAQTKSCKKEDVNNSICLFSALRKRQAPLSRTEKHLVIPDAKLTSLRTRSWTGIEEKIHRVNSGRYDSKIRVSYRWTMEKN